MSEESTTRAKSSAVSPGTYLSCNACGRLLKIHWPTRSIVCACGQRIVPPATPAK